MDTICRDCVFAEWHGNKQSGCEFDRIDKFEEQGATVTLEDNHDKLYAHIIGRVCNACRHPDTLSNVPVRKWKEKVREEIIPRITMAVYVDDDRQMPDAFRSLQSIRGQTVKPWEIVIIYNVGGKDSPSDYPNWFLANADDFAWRIQKIKGVLVPMSEELAPANYGQSIDLSVSSDKMTATYFASCKAGYEFPADYIETIDKAINDKLMRFIALLPDEFGNGLFVQRKIHILLRGNKRAFGCENIIDKLREISQEEGTEHMIKRFEDLHDETN